MMTSRGSNYKASRVDTLSGYHNTITAASRENGNTVSGWPHDIQQLLYKDIKLMTIRVLVSTRAICQQYSNSNLRYTAPTPSDAVAHEQVATYPK